MEEDRLILVDTNIFLEYLLDRERADDCEKLLGGLSKGGVEGAVTRFTLHSIEAVYRGDMLAAFLSNVDRSLGLNVQETSTVEEREVAELARKMRLDFDDALQYYVAKKIGAEAITSFDRHFDGLDLPRLEPGDVPRGSQMSPH